MSSYHVSKNTPFLGVTILQFPQSVSFDHQHILCSGFPSHFADEKNWGCERLWDLLKIISKLRDNARVQSPVFYTKSCVLPAHMMSRLGIGLLPLWLHLLMRWMHDVEKLWVSDCIFVRAEACASSTWLRKSHVNYLIYISQKHVLLAEGHLAHYLVNICTLLPEFISLKGTWL